MKNLKIAIIGLGVGERHLETYLRNKNCKIKYVCDFNLKTIKRVAKKISF